MALIEVGTINNFSVAVKNKKPELSMLESISTLSELKEVSGKVGEGAFELITAAEPRGVAIKSLKLQKGFEGFLSGIFDKTNEIYFIAWAWDLSGEPINHYPGADVKPEDVLITMKSGKLREFIGDGINLFPKRKVKGGIAIRIQIWESDDDVRKFGKAMSDTAAVIEKSELNKVLSLVSLATGVSGATITLVKEAALELTKAIGSILQKNSNDYVDFFEGYYASDQIWETGKDIYNGNASELTLKKY